MKKADLKEFIKQTMLETAPKKDTGAMTPEEEKMVADYEEEEANKYALDKEEPLEETSDTNDDYVIYATDEDGKKTEINRVPKSKAQTTLTNISHRYRDNDVTIRAMKASEWDKSSLEEVIKKADMIVESWANKKVLKEADLSQANFSDLHQVVKNIAHVNEIGMEEAAMQAIEYIAEQFDVPVDFRDF